MKKRKWRRRAALLAAFASALWLGLPAPAAEKSEKKKSKLPPEAVLFGSVFQENGFLLRGARVVVANADRPKQRKETTSDQQGEFAVRVPAGKGRYIVEVSAEGFASEKKNVEVTGDERIDLTFRLSPFSK